MLDSVKKDRVLQLVIVFYVLLFIWWILIFLGGTKTATVNYLFGGVYGSFALVAAFIGLKTSRMWGGTKSVFGKAVICFALGLFLQAFGQYVFWVYNFFLKIEIPYPSIADIGYFGSIPFYIYGTVLLARASGVNLSLKKTAGKLQVIIIPIVILGISFFLFLNKYEFNIDQPLKTFLDYGYPIGQAIYVSLALLTYSLSRGTLGGIMKSRVLFFLIALGCQYLADFSFLLFQDQYYNASFIDLIYMTAYFLMAIALLELRNVFQRLPE